MPERPGHTGPVTRVLRAGLATVFLSSLLAASGCSPSARCPAGASCPPVLPRLTYVLTVNGHPVPQARNGGSPRVPVRPGQHVLIKVAVTLPGTMKVAALWLGISAGPLGFSRKHRPAGLNPILARSRGTLAGGPHTFTLRWRIPEHRRGPLLLISAWSSSQPGDDVAGTIAMLAREPR